MKHTTPLNQPSPVQASVNRLRAGNVTTPTSVPVNTGDTESAHDAHAETSTRQPAQPQVAARSAPQRRKLSEEEERADAHGENGRPPSEPEMPPGDGAPSSEQSLSPDGRTNMADSGAIDVPPAEPVGFMSGLSLPAAVPTALAVPLAAVGVLSGSRGADSGSVDRPAKIPASPTDRDESAKADRQPSPSLVDAGNAAAIQGSEADAQGSAPATGSGVGEAEESIPPRADITAPPAVTPAPAPAPAPTLSLSNDTGTSASDHITADATLRVAGLMPNARWEYSLDQGLTWVEGQGDELPGGVFLDQGVHDVQVRQSDDAGIPGDVATITLTLDSIAGTAPVAVLSHDTGFSGVDFITRDGEVLITGLEADCRWDYSLDGGRTWTLGEGDRLDLASISGGGSLSLQVRQTDTAGNASTTAELDLTLLLTGAPVDLLIDDGLQNESHRTVGISAAQQGVALVGAAMDLGTTALQTLYVRIDGGLAENDQLTFNMGPVFNRDQSGTNATLAGLGGLDYRFDVSSGLLSIQKTNGSVLTGIEAGILANALRLLTTGSTPVSGERRFSLYGQDAAGNIGEPSTVRITVETRRPVLDLNGDQQGIDSMSYVNTLQTPTKVFSNALTITHENPEASYTQVTLRSTGRGTSSGDQLFSETILGLTPLTNGLQWQVGATQWTLRVESNKYTFTASGDGLASAEEVSSLLSSLRLSNSDTDAGQGARQFTVVLTDEAGNTARAESSVILDRTAPVVDLGGQAGSAMEMSHVVAGMSEALPLLDMFSLSLSEDNPITELKVELSSALSSAFGTAMGQHERIGLSDDDDSNGMSQSLVLGLGGSVVYEHSITGRVITLTLTADAARPVLSITADSPLTTAQAVQLLELLRYEADTGSTPGMRNITVTATDAAGNTTETPAPKSLEILRAGTPLVFLQPQSDTGDLVGDRITRMDGSASAPLQLRGTGLPNATLTLYRDADGNGVPSASEKLATVVCDDQGRWEWQLSTQALADGTHQFLAVDSDAGLTSPAFRITVDTRPPIGSFDMGASVTLSPQLSGVSDANERVVVEIDTDNNLLNGYELRYETRSDSSGQWRLDTGSSTPTSGSFVPFHDGDTVNTRVTTFDRAGNSTVRTDSAPAISSVFNLSDAQVVEGHDGTRELVFIVTRTGDLRTPGSVNWTLDLQQSSASNNPAGLLSDTDFTGATGGQVTFAAGESQQLVRFNVSGDYYREVNERLIVNLEKPEGGAVGDGLGIGTIYEIDINAMQAAYSMRDLNPNANIASIRVRRSSDGLEQDIGFDSNGDLDTVALLDFVGRSANDRGTVTTWYDQSGHGRDMLQPNINKQGVIVDGGVLVTRADGSPGISFNTRNGTADDYMTTAKGAAGTDWTSALIYAKVQSEGSKNGSLFNLGASELGRLSAHYPNDLGYVFDVNDYTENGRLQQAIPDGNNALLGRANDIVFEAHSGNTTAGTASLNFTDGAQVIYENGVRVTSDATISSSFPTSGEWLLARHAYYSTYFQQAIYNEFMVYLDTKNTAPDMRVLLGSSSNDVLTYSGETQLQKIDGVGGHDTLYLSGTTNLDFAQISGGVRGIAQVWMDNGKANTLTLTDTTLALNGDKPLTVVMGEGDTVVLNGQRIDYAGERAQTVMVGQDGNDVLVSTNRNDVMRGGGGADTFVWRVHDGGRDTVIDFSSAQGDQLDLSQLLSDMKEGREDLYISKSVDANGQVSLLIDRGGLGHFQDPELVIVLGSTHANDAIQIVTTYGTTTL